MGIPRLLFLQLVSFKQACLLGATLTILLVKIVLAVDVTTNAHSPVARELRVSNCSCNCAFRILDNWFERLSIQFQENMSSMQCVLLNNLAACM